jgi:hypothetical protein
MSVMRARVLLVGLPLAGACGASACNAILDNHELTSTPADATPPDGAPPTDAGDIDRATDADAVIGKDGHETGSDATLGFCAKMRAEHADAAGSIFFCADFDETDGAPYGFTELFASEDAWAPTLSDAQSVSGPYSLASSLPGGYDAGYAYAQLSPIVCGSDFPKDISFDMLFEPDCTETSDAAGSLEFFDLGLPRTNGNRSEIYVEFQPNSLWFQALTATGAHYGYTTGVGITAGTEYLTPGTWFHLRLVFSGPPSDKQWIGYSAHADGGGPVHLFDLPLQTDIGFYNDAGSSTLRLGLNRITYTPPRHEQLCTFYIDNVLITCP